MTEESLAGEITLNPAPALNAMRTVSNAAKQFTTGMTRRMTAAANSLKQIGRSIGLIGGAMAGAATLVARSSFDIQRSLGQLKSLYIDLGQEGARAAAKEIQEAALEMSSTFAGVGAKEIIDGAYSIRSAMSDLSSTAVADLAKMSATVAKATKASSDQIADLYTTVQATFGRGIDAQEFGDQFAGVIAQGVKQFKLDGPKIQAFWENAGATAFGVGRRFEEVIAIAGVLGQQIGGAEAGTALRTLDLQAGNVEKKFKQLAKTNKAFAGLTFVGEGGRIKEMPALIGEVEKAVKAAREGYAGAKGDQAELILLTELFGVKGRKVFDILRTQLDAVTSGEKSLIKAREDGIKTAEEMAKIMDEMFGPQVQLAMQKVGNIIDRISLAMGEMLAPGVKQINQFLTGIEKWVKENEGAAKSIGIIVTAVGALGAALVGVGTTLFVLGVALSGFSTAIAAIGGAIALVISPLGIMVAGLVAAGTLLARIPAVTDTVSGAFKTMGDAIKEAFGGIADAFVAGDLELAFQVATSGLRLVWAKAIAYLKSQWEIFTFQCSELFRTAVEDVAGLLIDLKASFLGIWQDVGNSVEDVWIDIAASFQSIWERAMGAVAKFILNIWQGIQEEFLDVQYALHLIDTDEYQRDLQKLRSAQEQSQRFLESDKQARLDAIEKEAVARQQARAAEHKDTLDRLEKERVATIAALRGTEGGTGRRAEHLARLREIEAETNLAKGQYQAALDASKEQRRQAEEAAKATDKSKKNLTAGGKQVDKDFKKAEATTRVMANALKEVCPAKELEKTLVTARGGLKQVGAGFAFPKLTEDQAKAVQAGTAVPAATQAAARVVQAGVSAAKAGEAQAEAEKTAAYVRASGAVSPAGPTAAEADVVRTTIEAIDLTSQVAQLNVEGMNQMREYVTRLKGDVGNLSNTVETIATETRSQ